MTISQHDDDPLDQLADTFIQQAIDAGISRETLFMHLVLKRTEEDLKKVSRQLQHEFCARLLVRFLEEPCETK